MPFWSELVAIISAMTIYAMAFRKLMENSTNLRWLQIVFTDTLIPVRWFSDIFYTIPFVLQALSKDDGVREICE